MILNHLLQSTLFAALAGLLTLAFRKNRAQVRYSLWLAASVKFLIPFSILIAAGNHFAWRAPAVIAQAGLSFVMEQVSQPFVAAVPVAAVPVVSQFSAIDWIPFVLFAIWAIGFLVVAASWLRRWRDLRAVLRGATPLRLESGIEALTSPRFGEPGVYGIRRPMLLLPTGIADQLTPAQFDAILAHELCHVRRRDNLATAIHMAVEAIFWFHPLVWWLGARLMDERERACDEEVLRAGRSPQVYAEGILKICELYVESPLQCIAGVTGANLKRRIEVIMANRSAVKLNFAKKTSLAVAGAVAIVLPIVIGMMNSQSVQAESAITEKFDVASVRPSPPIPADGRVFFGPPRGGPGTSDPDRITWTYATLKALLMQAYDMKPYQVNGPDWLNTERYDITATIPQGATKEQVNRMWRSLLAERFGVVLHHESKEFQVEELVIAKGGSKLKPSAEDDSGADGPPRMDKDGKLAGPGMINQIMNGPHGAVVHSIAKAQPVSRLTVIIGNQLNRPVLDMTGLTGNYDFELEFSPSPAAAGGSGGIEGAPDLTTAIQEQLGLKLVGGKAQLDTLVIDKADKTPKTN